MVEDTRFPQDVQVKKGYSWTEQMAIAVACLIEDNEMELVDWVKDVGAPFLYLAVLDLNTSTDSIDCYCETTKNRRRN
jgi:hypothetical protein